MPLYEYRCEACGAKEERLQSFSAPTAHDCPKCGGAEAMRREISRTAFVLSGSGWYANGYGEGGEAPAKAAKAPETPAKTETGAGEVPGAAATETKAACATGCACHSPKIQELTKEA